MGSGADDLGGESHHFALQIADALGATLALGMRGGEQVGAPCGKVVELLRRGGLAHGTLARAGRLVADARVRVVARLGAVVLGRKDRGVARGCGRRIRRRGVRVGARTLAADGGHRSGEAGGAEEVGLAKHRLLESSGVAGEVEAVELDIVGHRNGNTVGSHGWQEESRRLHTG